MNQQYYFDTQNRKKHTQVHTTKENYRPVFLISTNKKALTNCQQIKFSSISKRIIHCDHLGFMPVMQDWFSIQKSVNAVNHTNSLKKKSHMIVSIDAENLTKFTPIQKKKKNQPRTRENFLNLISSRHKTMAHIIFSGAILSVCPPPILGDKTRVSLHSQHAPSTQYQDLQPALQ